MKYNLKKYLILSFALAWIFQIAGSICAVKGSQLGFGVLNSIVMLMPMLAVILTVKGISKEKTGIGWKPKFKGKWRYWLIAWLSPTILTLLGAALYFIIFPGKFDNTMSEFLIAQGGEEVFRQITATMSVKAYFAVQLVSAMTWGAFTTMFFALGEEVGWRGYMYPALKEKFGITKGRFIGGLIWGAWHWPVIAIAGYEYGWSVFNSPWYLVAAGMLMFPVMTIAYGTITDWVYEKTGSIWAPALWHGALNSGAAIGMLMLKADYAGEMYLGPAPVGIIGGLPLIIMGVVILIKSRKRA